MSVDIETSRMNDRFDMTFLEKVLVDSAYDGRVPTGGIWILGVVSKGVVGYLGGNIKSYSGEHLKDFRIENWKRIRGFFEGFDGEFNPSLKDSVLRMTKAHNDSDGMESFIYTKLEEDYCGNGGCGLRPCAYPQNAVPVDSFMEFLSLPFNESEERDLLGIVEAMKPLVEKDIEYIREHYSW